MEGAFGAGGGSEGRARSARGPVHAAAAMELVEGEGEGG